MWNIYYNTNLLLTKKSFYSEKEAKKFHRNLSNTCNKMFKLYSLDLSLSLFLEQDIFIVLKRAFKNKKTSFYSYRNNRLFQDIKKEAKIKQNIKTLLNIQRLNWPTLNTFGELYAFLSNTSLEICIQRSN